MVLFSLADSPEEAINAVKTGTADSAWIFPADMGTVGDFALLNHDAVIRIVEREQNVILRLAHEKLNAELFRHLSRAYGIEYARLNLPELERLSEQELLDYFENTVIDDTLFVFDNPVSSSKQGGSDYLTAPLRGLLALITVLGGMAGALYYMQDEEKRLFANISLKKQPFIAFASIGVATLNVSLISMVALLASGLYRFGITELAAALLYALASAAFCLLTAQIFRSVKVYGAILPALITVMSCVCPVFFNLKELRGLSWLFPPTYYINAATNSMCLVYMLIYTAVLLALATAVRLLCKIKA